MYSNCVGSFYECFRELGRKAREEAERQAQVQRDGYAKRQQLAKEGQKMKEEKRKRLDELKKSKTDLEPQREDLELRKKEIETKESDAKKRHQEAWEAQKAAKSAERDRQAAEAAFKELDVDQNGRYVSSALCYVHLLE